MASQGDIAQIEDYSKVGRKFYKIPKQLLTQVACLGFQGIDPRFIKVKRRRYMLWSLLSDLTDYFCHGI
jgi:hypothetical protein